MERAIYIVGAVLGSLFAMTLLPSYETDTYIDRAFTGCVVFATVACVGGLILPYFQARDR